MRSHVSRRAMSPATVGPAVRLSVPVSPRVLRQTADIRTYLGRPVLQPKLRVGAANDPLEREADRVADQVMRMPEERVQRACLACNDEIQRQPLPERDLELEEDEGGATASDLMSLKPLAKPDPIGLPQPPSGAAELGPGLEGAVRSIRGQGRPLEPSTRAYFEPRFGRDFSRVQVHSGERAGKLARALGARAFAVGDDLVFGRGEYRPGSWEGKTLLAHELSHVLQQRGRPATLRRKELCDCPKLGLTKPNSSEVTELNSQFPDLNDGDWCITGPKTPTYNCFAWTVGDTTKWLEDSIDTDYGDNDGTLEVSDFDGLYDAQSLKPGPLNKTPADPEVALFATAGDPIHAARKSVYSCSGMPMFESKLGKHYRVIHPVRHIEKGLYGNIARWYVKK